MVGKYLRRMLTSRRVEGGQGHWEWASIDLAERHSLRACRRESSWRLEDLEQMDEYASVFRRSSLHLTAGKLAYAWNAEVLVELLYIALDSVLGISREMVGDVLGLRH